MNFSLSVTLQKVLKSAIKATLGVVIGFIGAENLQKHGIQVDVEILSGGLAILVIGLLEGLRNIAKNKLSWKWL